MGTDLGSWGQGARPSPCPATAATRCRWRTSRAGNLSSISTPGPTRRAAPAKPSTLAGCAPQFAKAGTEILGVSADPVKAQDAFKKKHNLTIGLLSDETHKMLEAYGAWGKKSMYGKSFMGIVRITVLIGPNGKIAHIWPKVKVDGHADEVLAAAKAL